jgi:protein-disulfide isomerase
VLHQIAAKYLDTGKAKVTYRHFSFIGDESDWAANASECANEQGKFWDYANYLFTHQAGENKGAFSRNNLKQFAVALKLDTSAFNTCFDSNKYAYVIKQDTAEGQRRGVRSTPTFFVNGQRIEAVVPAEQLSAMIDRLQPK